MAGVGGQFGINGREDRPKVSSLPENVCHVSSLPGVPAVLRTEAADISVEQGFVQLVFERGGPE